VFRVWLFGKLVIYLAGADRGDIDHAAASRRRPRWQRSGTMVSGLGLTKPVGEVSVLVAAGLAVAASVLPSVVGTIASLGPGWPVLSLDAWQDSAWAWSSTVLLAAAGVCVLIGGGWSSRQPSSWCWPATLLMVLVADLSLIGSFLWPQNPGATSATFRGLVLRHPELGQWLGASLGPGLGFYLSVIAALLATAGAVAVVRGKIAGYEHAGANPFWIRK
jgi:hypothetical protein